MPVAEHVDADECLARDDIAWNAHVDLPITEEHDLRLTYWTGPEWDAIPPDDRPPGTFRMGPLVVLAATRPA